MNSCTFILYFWIRVYKTYWLKLETVIIHLLCFISNDICTVNQTFLMCQANLTSSAFKQLCLLAIYPIWIFHLTDNVTFILYKDDISQFSILSIGKLTLYVYLLLLCMHSVSPELNSVIFFVIESCFFWYRSVLDIVARRKYGQTRYLFQNDILIAIFINIVSRRKTLRSCLIV